MILTALTITGVTFGAIKLYENKRKKTPWFVAHMQGIQAANNRSMRASRKKSQSLFKKNRKKKDRKTLKHFLIGSQSVVLNAGSTQPKTPYNHDIPQELSHLLKRFLRKLEEERHKIKLLWHNTYRLATEQSPFELGVESSDKSNMGIPLRYIWAYTRPHWRQILLMAPGLLALPLFTTYVAFCLKFVLDNMFIMNIVPVFAATLVGFVAMTALSIYGQQLLWDLAAQVGRDIRHDIFIHLQDLSPSFYQRNFTGDILTKFASDAHALEASTARVILSINSWLFLIINIPVLFILEWHLALLAVATLSTLFVVSRGLTARAISGSYRTQQATGQVGHILHENVKGQMIIKGLSMKRWHTEVFNEKLEIWYHERATSRFSEGLVSVCYQIFTLLTELLVYGAGVLLVIKGSLPIGSLIAFIAILGEFKKNIFQLSGWYAAVLSDAGRIHRLHDLFQERPEVTDHVDAKELTTFSKELRFANVSFAYNQQRTILHSIDLVIPFGQHVAFVGSSGAGKSTILSLILRFYDVTEGSITIDGVDIRQVTQASLRKQMSVVLQDPLLFDTTIYENIRVSKPDATQEEIELAAKSAEIHDFIISLPDGYQTRIGEAGGQLSGGQKQRISIARALLRQPAILILDEPTAALDAETRADMNRTLASLSKERTVVSVTHLLPSVVSADQIFVIDAGEVAERGTHEELLVKRGLYHQLWHKQTEAYLFNP